MANPVSSMFTDPVNSAQALMDTMTQETEEQRKKRLQQQKMTQASGNSGVSSLFNPAGNQY